MLTTHIRLIIERLNQMRLPAIHHFPEIAEAGGPLGYGGRLRDLFRQAADLIAKLLAVRDPKTTIPASLLARADEVIE